MKKLAILTLSLLTLMAGAAFSPLLNSVSRDYPNIQVVLIKSLVTIPSLMVIVTSIIFTKYLRQRCETKTIIIIGLTFYIIGGLIPSFFPVPFYLLVISRIILGIGLGLIAPLSISIISEFYSGSERTKMIGLSSSMNNLGTVIAVLFAGFVGLNSWRNGLLVYLISFIPLVLILIYFPNTTSYKKSNIITSKKSQGKVRLKRELIITYIQIFFATMIYFIIPTSLSFYLTSFLGKKASILTGVLMALISSVGVLSGLLYKRIYKMLGRYTQQLVFSLFFISMFLIINFENLFILSVALLFSGFSLGIALPLFNQKIFYYSNDSNDGKEISIGTSLIFMGQFVSPIFINFTIKIFHLNILKGPFIIGCLLSLILLLLSQLTTSNKNK